MWLPRITYFLINRAVFLSHYLEGKSTEPQWSESSMREARLACLLVAKITVWVAADGKENTDNLTSVPPPAHKSQASQFPKQLHSPGNQLPWNSGVLSESRSPFLNFSLNKAVPWAIWAGSLSTGTCGDHPHWRNPCVSAWRWICLPCLANTVHFQNSLLVLSSELTFTYFLQNVCQTYKILQTFIFSELQLPCQTSWGRWQDKGYCFQTKRMSI